ncbi:Alcohol dehydrogenase superfamily, zinc-type [Corchorus capsularis]|uniref:cinnamyl-alcohol dehydrogenase n=1 Tax=Corchorus capsularis TaxID=210143 RepID=A0A1R3JK73_COCAP|nr:Alcohol dehydrogenase superfamily, zinc-type [Corchorus capsularis]
MDSQTKSDNCLGWAARDPSGVLSPYTFSRRPLGSNDVSIKITHCGVCYADFIWSRNKHGDSMYPVVPGHEIAGVVKEVGSNVHRFKVGDPVGVGTYVNSCRDSPLLCAGITVYAPMMRHNMNQPGKSLGVIGLGGLGHMAVKFGKAFGLHVTVLSTSISKKDEALSLLGADNFVVSSDQEQMKGLSKSLDFIVDTASGDHPFDPYMSLLKIAGVYVLVGFPSEVKFSPASLNLGMRTISGSVTGGVKVIQEMIDFCAAHKVYPQIEVIPIQYANEALERLEKRDVKYRFVIDIENSLK